MYVLDRSYGCTYDVSVSFSRSRKLNAVLEGAIQEAMAELDRMSAKAKKQTNGQKLKRRAAEGASYGESICPPIIRNRRS